MRSRDGVHPELANLKPVCIGVSRLHCLSGKKVRHLHSGISKQSNNSSIVQETTEKTFTTDLMLTSTFIDKAGADRGDCEPWPLRVSAGVGTDTLANMRWMYRRLVEQIGGQISPNLLVVTDWVVVSGRQSARG